MEPVEEAYANATVILRPPRVAVLFRGDENWRAWARLTISVAGKYWGGAGFILVPFAPGGTVSPKMISMVQAYDPDHVVAVRLAPSEYERVAPGWQTLLVGNKPLVDPLERLDFIRNTVMLPTRDGEAMRARDFVADACTPLRNAFPGGDRPAESVQLLDFEPETHRIGLIPAARGARRGVVLAVAEHWQDDAALSLAIRTGVLPHAQEQALDEERAQPAPAQMLRLALDPERWSRRVPDALAQKMNIGRKDSNDPTRFWSDDPAGGLTPVRSGIASEGGAIVIGDTAADFALAYAYERLLGLGVWLTSDMLRDLELSKTLASAVEGVAERINARADWLCFTSASLDDGELVKLCGSLKTRRIDTDPFSVAEAGEMTVREALPDGVQFRTPSLRRGLHQLVVNDPLVTSLSVPVSVGQDGTMVLRAPLETPMPLQPMPTDGFVRPYWYVGVDLSDTMPRSRSVPQEFVVIDRQQPYGNNGVRSGRDGLVYPSQGGGSLVMAGTPLNQQLFKPRLKTLGMQPWVQAMAAKADMEARLSQPGAHAQLLARRAGGRRELTAMVASTYHPALKLFASGDDKSTDAAFPNHDGCLLGRDPYPTFKALRRVLPGISETNIRGWIDMLAGADLLRRGFILDCLDCTRPSFMGLDEVGQRYQCPRCSAANELSAARWNTRDSEPPWFYDLHPSFRELMAQHGDVGLLMAERLRRENRLYADVAEMQFHRAGKRKPFAEIDLIAHADGSVVVVEAKSNNRLGSRDESDVAAARKKAEVAVALHADKIIVATTEDTWAGGTQDALEKAVAEFGAGSIIEIELVTGLKPDGLPGDGQ